MYDFITAYQNELTLFFLGGTIIMIIFALFLWYKIRDKTFLIYIALNIAVFFFFIRNSDLILFLCERLNLSLQELWQYTEHSLGIGFVLFYSWFIYSMLDYPSKFSKRVIILVKLYFIVLSCFIPIDWYLLFVEESLESSYQLQQFTQPLTCISQIYIIYLGLTITGHLNRILSITYLIFLFLLPSFVLLLTLDSPNQIFFPYDENNFIAYRVFVTCHQLSFFLENIVFIYAFVYRVQIYQEEKELARYEAIQKQQEAQYLKELEVQKNHFFTNISHEFRTPLTVILGMVEQIKADSKRWGEEGIESISRNGQLLLKLVNQVLDLSKTESGHLRLDMRQGNIIPFTGYLVDSFHVYAASKNIRLRFIREEENIEMDFDGERLKQVICNLISNALKFTPEGGEVRVILSKELRDGSELLGRKRINSNKCLLISIKDTGKGISQKHLDKIFDRFYQVNDGVVRTEVGTGIGLALAKEFIHLMGGEIWVKSQLGMGSTFYIALPIRNDAEKMWPNSTKAEFTDDLYNLHAQRPKLNQEVDKYTNLGKPNLLLIEDNQDIIRYLRALLEDKYHIEVVYDGKEGLVKAQKSIPDVIISDVMMPEMDGYELCKQLKEGMLTSHIPVILLTAKDDKSSRIRGIQKGADAYLAKPFNQEELMATLRRSLMIRKTLQQKYGETDKMLQIKNEENIESQFLQQLDTIIHANLSDESFRVEPHLCRAIGMSRPQLYRKLKALKNQSPSAFIQSVRIKEARKLLLSTDKPIAEIADLVGFKEASYFAKVYQKVYGESPSETRKF